MTTQSYSLTVRRYNAEESLRTGERVHHLRDPNGGSNVSLPLAVYEEGGFAHNIDDRLICGIRDSILNHFATEPAEANREFSLELKLEEEKVK